MQAHQVERRGLVITGLIFYAALIQGCESKVDSSMGAGAITVLACSEPVWEIGDIDQQKHPLLVHEFSLQNRTDESINVTSVKPDCGCLLANDVPDSIPPNSVASVVVQLTPTDIPGPIDHLVLVKFESGEEGTLVLRVRGRVLATRAIHVFPQILDFALLTAAEKKTRLARIQRRNGSTVKIRGVTSNLSTDQLEMRRSPDGVSMDISVTLSPKKLPPGEIAGFINVDMAEAEQSPLRIPVKGYVQSIRESFVSSLLIESLKPGDSADFPILRSAGSLIEVRVAKVAYEGDAGIQVSLTPASDRQSSTTAVAVNVTLSHNVTIGATVKGSVAVYFDEDTERPIDIPIYAFIR